MALSNQTLKLYHYVHCPFCLRVRMVLGLFNIAYTSIPLNYDDEVTPKKLVGVKMLPIMQFEDGDHIGESLDIIRRLDKDEKLAHYSKEAAEIEEFNHFLSKIGNAINSLCMPYWIYTPEFNEQSRNYFRYKKEVKRGPFKKLMQDRHNLELEVMGNLEHLEKQLKPFYKNDKLTIYDIMLASHLWGLYLVSEFQFSQAMHNYLQEIKSLCKFSYFLDVWENSFTEAPI